MLFRKTTQLNKPIDTVWRHLLSPNLLAYVARPMQAFKPIEPAKFPQQWEEGSYKIQLLNFGVIPMGEHYIVIEMLTNTDTHKQVRDNGHGKMIHKWDHLIELHKLMAITLNILMPWKYKLAFLPSSFGYMRRCFTHGGNTAGANW